MLDLGRRNFARSHAFNWTQMSAGCTQAGYVLTKVGADAWDGSATTSRGLRAGVGGFEFVAQTDTAHRMTGLGPSTPGASFSWLLFSIYLTAVGSVVIYESGSSVVSPAGPYVAGDRFRVAVEGSAVVYRQNGTLLYTSLVAPSWPLFGAATIFSNGGTVGPAVLLGGRWV